MFSKSFRRSRLRRVGHCSGSPALVAIEPLEELQLLSATPLLGVVASPLVTAAPVSSASGAASSAGAAESSAGAAATHRQPAPSVTNSTPLGDTPAQIAEAYGFNQITFDNGTLAGNGAGQTIAIVDAYFDPNISSDLQKFDAQFGLAAPPSFTQAVEQGATGNAGWDLETSLDVEWAHAMAPGANIVLVEANNSSLSSLLAAVNYARNLANVSVVSMSWGASEFSSETAYDSDFTTPAGHTGITFVASSGDGGAGTTWPSVSPNVLAVGGTTLTTGAGGAYVGETAWSDSGGGISTFETEPSYQTSVQSTGQRTTPDVAYDANPDTGFAVYDSVSYAGQSGWFEVGGTSAGAPQWSALIAIADQGRATAGLAPLANAQAMLYTLPAGDFHDITAGSNGNAATTGYDLVTGRGSPVVTSLMRALTGATTFPAPTAAVTGSSSTQAARPDATTTNGEPVSTIGTTIAKGVSTSAPSFDDALEVGAEPANGVWFVRFGARTDSLQNAEGGTVVPSLADAPGSTAAQGNTSIGTSIGTNSAGTELVGPSDATWEMSAGLPQLGSARAAGAAMTAEASPAIDRGDAASEDGSQGPDSVFSSDVLSPDNAALSFDNVISSRAIDAYFATGGSLTEGAAAVAPTHSAGLGKTALAGIAASLGLAGLWRGIRARRRRGNAT